MTDFVRIYTERLDDEGVVIAITTINEDGSVSNIPLDLENSDYQAYLNKDNPVEHFTPSLPE